MGSVVFSAETPINSQITMYLLSRVLVGLARLVAARGFPAPPRTFAIFSSLVWGLVMLLFYRCPKVLQPSLAASMKKLYLDSDAWSGYSFFAL
eukprot:NODE_3910_length_391_cov_85.599415_g3471_i0.p2 GENE.NODE_3910_length_391_cov_85.599415_g3471_i0~~NODE_3910_length_391_cov_85.599415_g3471_i0.p2  ORF type:complete len:93 (+),score=4.69 NODE_3910_length_391_cov_85.599415_g3471_i0:28-306(+)